MTESGGLVGLGVEFLNEFMLFVPVVEAMGEVFKSGVILVKLGCPVDEFLLEISVESQGYFKLEEDDVAKLMTRLGINLQVHAEGYQICPGNSRKIMIWLKDHVDISRFCKDESFRINENV